MNPAATRRRTTSADIVDAAAALCARTGVDGVGVGEIAKAVGISPGAIYRHFRSKDAVLDAVLLDLIDTWLVAAVPDTADDDDDAHRALTSVVTASVQLVADRPGHLATYVRQRHRASTDVRRLLAQRESTLFGRWRDVMIRVTGELSHDEIVLRQATINGVLSALALRRGSMTPALRDRVVSGLLAVAGGPQPVDGRATATEASAPTWIAPTSRREQIIDVAMRLFAVRGYHGVGMDEIGEAVGMSGPSLYEHVGAKPEILLDAYDRAGALVTAGAAEALAGAASASDALDRLIDSFAAVAVDHVDLITVTSQEGSALPESERPRLGRRRRDLHEMWSGVMRQLDSDLHAGDARALAAAALGTITTLARQQRAERPVDAAAHRLTRCFLDGATSPLRQPASHSQELQ